uniref:Inner membrane protein YpjD n=2 Tax=Vibrio algicola TaxID=2662262 RepID=A0A5Q0TK15_9VIBR
MRTMEHLLSIIAALLYCSAISMIIPGLVQSTGIKIKLVFVLAALAITTHGWLLSDLILNPYGQNFSILNVASLISFIVCLTLSLAMLKTRLWFLLPVVYSFAVINLLAATFLPSTFLTHFDGKVELLLHITIALFAYSTLSIGALYALQLAWLDHKLKAKKALTINPNLPPLMMVERHLFKIILIGTLLLTATLLTGAIYIKEMFDPENAHKAVLSFIAWALYCILLWGHYRQGWRGKKVLWLSISGTTLLTLAYFGSRFVREIILN